MYIHAYMVYISRLCNHDRITIDARAPCGIAHNVKIIGGPRIPPPIGRRQRTFIRFAFVPAVQDAAPQHTLQATDCEYATGGDRATRCACTIRC